MIRILTVLFLFSILSLSAKPQYTMLTGNRCINCHYDPNGNGMRNDLGFYSSKDIGIIKPKNIGLGEFFDQLNSNNIYEDKISVGMDTRFQSFREGGPQGSEREIVMMQATPYLRFSPFEWLNFYGKYNFSDETYPGQSKYGFDVKIQPGFKFPYLRIGMIQPLMGNRYDDHTIMLRNSTGIYWSQPMAPPDYHEYGVEIGYDAIKWLGLYAGVYSTNNLAKISLLGNQGALFQLSEKDNYSKAIKIKINKNFSRNTYNTELGASYFLNDNFDMLNIYLNLGWTDYISLLTEYVISNRNDFQEVSNYMVELSYKVYDPLIIYARYEKASTDLINNDLTNNFNAEQIVLGGTAKIFPFIELRPEYRIFDRSNYPSYGAQYTVQLHLYF